MGPPVGLEPTHYRVRAGYSATELRWLVRATGFEPVTTRFRTEHSGLTELHPGLVATGGIEPPDSSL